MRPRTFLLDGRQFSAARLMRGDATNDVEQEVRLTTSPTPLGGTERPAAYPEPPKGRGGTCFGSPSWTMVSQFVDIPEFTDLGDKVTAQLSAVIAGNGTVDAALEQGQALATSVAANYK